MSGTSLNRVIPKALGEMLIEKGYITQEQCEEALTHSRKEGVRLGEALIQLGYIRNDVLSYALGEQFGVRPVELDATMIDPGLIRRFPLDLLRRHLILPLIEIGDEIVVVISDPNDSRGLQAVTNLVPDHRVSAQIGDPRHIRRCLDAPPFNSLKGGGYVPTPVPTDWEADEEALRAAEPNVVHWLVTSAVQRPEADLFVRNDGREIRVLRRISDVEAAPVEHIHTLGVQAFPALREDIWQNCIKLSHTEERVGMWNVPLRFAGKRFGLEVAMGDDQAGSYIHLRSLEYEEQLIERSGGSGGSVPGSVAVVLYEDRHRVEAMLSKFLSSQPENQIIVLFQDATRRIFSRGLSYPGLHTNVEKAVAAVGATCIIFDYPISPNELARVRHAVTPYPAVVICGRVSGRNEVASAQTTGLELRPRIAPDLVEIIRLYKPEVIHLGSAGDDVKEMSSFSAMEFLGVSK